MSFDVEKAQRMVEDEDADGGLLQLALSDAIAEIEALREKLAAADKKLASPIFKDDVNGEIEVQCLRARAEAAEARLKEAEKERDVLDERWKYWRQSRGELLDDCKAVEKRAERLREALKYYADNKHADDHILHAEDGTRAREALAADSAAPSKSVADHVKEFTASLGGDMSDRDPWQERPTLCKCGKPATSEIHPCPFDEDVNNDPRPKCHCCRDCQYECAQDI